MQQLVEHNVITHPIVAINARDSSSTTGSDTVVKFGGWDKTMVKDEKLMLLYTVPDDNGKAQFALKSQNWKMGGVDINKSVEKVVHFNPSLPYMYIPVSDYSQLTANITDKTLYPSGTPPTI